jgi:hypothetical protein
MPFEPVAHVCPDCDEPIAFTFSETSGLGGWKRGDGYNTATDTAHYVCFPCGRAWKQRLDGPLTADVVGDLAFFSCRQPECGQRLEISHESGVPTDVQLACPAGHRYQVVSTEEGGLTLVETNNS